MKKHLFLKSLLIAIGLLIASINTAWATGTRTVYLNIQRHTSWTEASATFYINNSDAAGGRQFTLVTGESYVYSAEIDDTWTSVYFTRCSSNGNTKHNSFSATLDATHNCGVLYGWDAGYLGWYFPEATEFYINDYQTIKNGSAMNFSDANAYVWVRYYLDNTSNEGTAKLSNTTIETISGHKIFHFTLPKGTWDAVIVTRTGDDSFGYGWGQTADINFDLGKNYLNNGSWSTYAPSLTSVSLDPATAYSGGGTEGNPYLVSPSSIVRVDADPTSPVSDGSLTVKYTYKGASNNELKGQSTDEYYQFTASAVNGTTYSVKVEANNYYGATAGATARTSSVLYFQVSATPAVALAVSTAGPIASGTELTLTATPSNTTETPTYSYYYSTDAGDNYTAIAGTDVSPVTSTTQRFTPAVNSPGTYQFKVIMHHSSSDYACTTFPTTDVQQRRTMAVKNKFTDLYGYNTIVNASTPSVTGIYNTLSATRDAAPDGYVFAGWEKTSSLSFVSGDATSSSTSVTMSASADDQTLTALYTAKKRIYFDNTMTNWPGPIYVYFFDNSSGWYNSGKTENDGGQTGTKGPGLVPKHSAHHSAMTHIENTNIWYYEYDGAYTPTRYVAFTKGNMDGWWSVKKGSYAYLEDYDECLPMYIASTSWQEYNYSGNHKYGYWKRYNTTHSGYNLIGLHDGNDDKDYWDRPDDEVEFTSLTPNNNTFKAKVHLNNATWNFKISRCHGADLGNTGTMTPTNHSGWEMTPILTDCHIEIPSGGDYEFTINMGTDHIYLSVEYPLLANDYRLLYTGRITTDGADDHQHPTQAIRHLTKADTTIYDTVSIFIDADHIGSLKMQKCIDPSANSGKGSWSDTITGISLTGVKTTGVYSFVITQTTTEAGVRTASVTPLDENFKYAGPLYIRTDVADGGWEAYKEVENNMLQYSDYSKAHSGYDYYHVHFTPTSKNLHFTIANDYSPSISDTMTTGASPFTFDALPYQASVRFMYNSETNKLDRAYLNGSSEGGDATYLILNAKNDSITETNGDAISKTDGINSTTFEDLGNWVYQKDLKAIPGTHVRLISNYYYSSTPHYQYFKGNSGDWDASTTEQIIGGTGEAQTLRLVYDYKTNHLVSAWLAPASGTTPDLALYADVMIIREEQKDARQITFSSDDKLTEVDTVYAVMQFNKYSINNRKKDNSADSTLTAEALRNLYWISFPFDVKLNDVFGFGTYGTHWGIEYYDGKDRADKGYWADSEGFWKLVTPEERLSFILKANVGYLLVLDLDLLTTSSKVWEYTDNVSLYFPSKDKVGSIQTTNKTIPIDQEGYLCSIDRRTDKSVANVNKDRRIADSYWHVIGVPSYANKTRGSLPTSEPTDPTWTGDVLYVYVWDGSTGAYTVTSSESVNFKTMYSYMVQYSGETISWTSVSATPDKKPIIARKKDRADYDLRLELRKGDQKEDQTYVRMTDNANVTNAFEFNYDLFKEMNGGKANIWTVTSDVVPAAGNVMPFSENTTTVPVGVKIATSGNYTFTIPDGTDGVGVVLIDNIAGTRTNLALEDYTVNLTQGNIDGRFSLEISPISEVHTDVEAISDQNADIRKVMVDGILYIVKDGKVFDARGNRVK